MDKIFMIKQPETRSVFANNYIVCAGSESEAKRIRLDRDRSANNEKIIVEVIGEASPELEIGVLMLEVIRR